MATENLLAGSSRMIRRRTDMASLAGLAIVGAWILVALLAPLLAPHGQADLVGDSAFGPMSADTLLGTDSLGRDVFSRLLYGARLTLGLAAVTTFFAFVGGVLLGGIAGLFRGLLDTLLSRAVDALLAFPAVMLALIVITGLGTSLPVLVGTVALIEGTRVFRLSRALTMEISVTEFVEAARLQGEGTLWIVWKEILPNILQPLVADLGLRFTYSILFISALSFLGLGVQPPQADWGGMVRENMSGLLAGSLAPMAPAAAIASITIGVTLTLDSLVRKRDLGPA
ncbi:MAG TPA: ABC transporter permease [Hypericibacter adhaerens]|jgi:peptide/nickel transport system permease protein|uniref:ABC transporter permease n=1 Tax=Hypericibacter adhaerens TaxID=2602016 RepID=A0A5J6MUQ3_9PROT|nr:ABC transporter permease [Hypericibacter adhaerens]QEX20981.1 ABC transporter permease [Hypericibacter adhaerens]HWA42207.1 ABC transporter permease [Hypericibacter adhaerens]